MSFIRKVYYITTFLFDLICTNYDINSIKIVIFYSLLNYKQDFLQRDGATILHKTSVARGMMREIRKVLITSWQKILSFAPFCKH